MMAFLETLARYAPEWIDQLAPATLVTMAITFLSYAIAICIAVVVEWARGLGNRTINAVIGGYIAVARGVPILAILYLLYFGLPGAGILLSAFQAGVLGISLVYGAYLAEVFRAGIGSLHKGQREAAVAVGMTPLQAFRLIILPQAIRIMLPPLLVTFVSLLKDSSICALIAVNELVLTSRVMMAEYFLPLHIFVLVGMFYFVIAWPLSLLARWLEKRMMQGRRVLAT
jgi:His/Glu/Gln/Arg/opine family amino acid ABC transporter permease subunit